MMLNIKYEYNSGDRYVVVLSNKAEIVGRTAQAAHLLASRIIENNVEYMKGRKVG